MLLLSDEHGLSFHRLETSRHKMDDRRFCVPEDPVPGDPFPEDPFADQTGSKPGIPSKPNAKKSPCSKGQVDIIAMVRSLQRTAGTADCFRRGNADCDNIDCDWRTYCLSGAPETKKKELPPGKKER